MTSRHHPKRNRQPLAPITPSNSITCIPCCLDGAQHRKATRDSVATPAVPVVVRTAVDFASVPVHTSERMKQQMTERGGAGRLCPYQDREVPLWQDPRLSPRTDTLQSCSEDRPGARSAVLRLLFSLSAAGLRTQFSSSFFPLSLDVSLRALRLSSTPLGPARRCTACLRDPQCFMK